MKSLLNLCIYRSKIGTSNVQNVCKDSEQGNKHALMLAHTRVYCVCVPFCKQTRGKNCTFFVKINYFNEGAIQYIIMLEGNKDLYCNAPDIMVNAVFYESNDGWKKIQQQHHQQQW